MQFEISSTLFNPNALKEQHAVFQHLLPKVLTGTHPADESLLKKFLTQYAGRFRSRRYTAKTGGVRF